LMGAALPVWNKQAQREREEEYLFRASEYARAIQKFQKRAGPGTLPPNFDVLVEGRFLRRKYKDPFTGGDFQPVFQTVAAPGQFGATRGNATPGGLVGSGQAAQSNPFTQSTRTAQTGGTPTSGQGAPTPGAGVIGVTSKSKAKSIKIYNGRTSYDQWAVTVQDVKPAGRGLPPDLLQALNATRAGAAGGTGASGGGQGGANPFGQGGANPFGQGGTPRPGQPGTNPFGGAQPPPFGTQPGTSPFGGQAPGPSPFGPPPAGGNGTVTPSYPPPAGGGGLFGAVPRKQP
ncbi:MAG: hypothetical protein ABI880_15645, partial [Acidobacteriota bacterium]